MKTTYIPRKGCYVTNPSQIAVAQRCRPRTGLHAVILQICFLTLRSVLVLPAFVASCCHSHQLLPLLWSLSLTRTSASSKSSPTRLCSGRIVLAFPSLHFLSFSSLGAFSALSLHFFPAFHLADHQFLLASSIWTLLGRALPAMRTATFGYFGRFSPSGPRKPSFCSASRCSLLGNRPAASPLIDCDSLYCASLCSSYTDAPGPIHGHHKAF